MSKAADVYNAFLSVADATLTGYTENPNPYISDENPIHLFDKSFGIQYGPGQNTFRLASDCSKVSRDLSLIIVLINKINFTESNQAGLRSQQISIQEDLFNIQKATCLDGTINDVASKFDYFADSGIEFVDAGDIKYYLLEAQFSFEYFDDI